VDNIERRLSGALKARADEVTDDALSDLDLGIPTRTPRRRWPVVAAVAGLAAALVIGLALIPGVFRSTPPPEITSPATPCESACHVIQRLTVDGDSLEVWAGARPDAWEVRVRGVPVAGFQKGGGNIVPTNPLTCWTMPSPARCLVRTTGAGTQTVWVGLAKDNTATWRAEGVMFTLAEVDSVTAIDMAFPRDPRTAVFTERVEGRGWFAEVWSWDGTHLGCTPFVDTREKLPGWPDLRPQPEDLVTKCWT